MSSLPPGCTDEMCEGGPEQFCATCGHSEEFHVDEDPCDHVGCECKGYVEGEYEPEIDEDRMKGID